jgi:hypothetical protein
MIMYVSPQAPMQAEFSPNEGRREVLPLVGAGLLPGSIEHSNPSMTLQVQTEPNNQSTRHHQQLATNRQ